MSQETAQMFNVSSGWLDARAPTVANLNVTQTDVTTGNCIYDFQPCSPTVIQCGQWWPTSPPARPIRLSLAEVDQLRKAAKADAKLKAVLEKFTEQIEVIVEFGK